MGQLRENGVQYTTTVPKYRTIKPTLKLDFDLHHYQQEGLQAWIDADCLGTVILPTGAGKTLLALKAIEHVGRSTLIIVPTIDLLNQWYDLLTNAFDLEIGILGGGYHELQEITVTTYDSAYRYSNEYGNRFGFLIFDEVHHLPSPKLQPHSRTQYRFETARLDSDVRTGRPNGGETLPTNRRSGLSKSD